jgi:ABC-2 type transport system permease protein
VKLKRITVITSMELKKIWHDKRRLLIFVLGPIILSIATGYIAYKSPYEINVTVLTEQFNQSSPFSTGEAQQLINVIDSSSTFSVTEGYSPEEARQRLDNGATRAIIIISEGSNGIEDVKVIIDVTDPSIQHAVYSELQDIFKQYSDTLFIRFLTQQGLPLEQAEEVMSPLDFKLETNSLQEGKFLDSYASALIIMFAMAIALLASVTSITSERVKGTMERIFVSPYRRSEIILSKMIAYSIFALIVIIFITITLKLAFDVMLGNIFLVLLIAILVGINAVIFGILVSSITYTELESVFVGTVFMFLFMILMGFMWPFETMHPLFKYMSYMTPYIYSVDAIRYVNLVGWGFSDVWPDLLILCGFIAVQAVIAMLILRREIR